MTPDRLLACRGSDEAIDLLVRAFCRAGRDRVMICPPTFAMYGFAAAVQDAAVEEVPLAGDFGARRGRGPARLDPGRQDRLSLLAE